MKEGRYYNIVSTDENSAGLVRLLAVTAPSAGGEYLSDKFNEFVEAAKFEVRLGDVRLIDRSRVAADLTISEAGVAVKYNVYLREKAIELQFHSTDRSRVELAARLLRLAGIVAEVQKAGGRDKWYVYAYTDRLAAGREELRKALADFVRQAVKNGLVEAGKAEGWLKKLEEGRVLMEGWPKYSIQLTKGALVVRFSSPNPDSIEREAQRLRDMGLEEGRHFTVKTPEEGHDGYVSILREGLERAARLSVRGKDEQQRRLAAKFVEYILRRAEKEGEKVCEKAQKIIEEGKAWGSLKLKDFEREVEVNGRRFVVKVISGGAEFDKGRGGRKLLRIKITAEVDGVRSDHTITYGRRGRNVAVGRAYARADVPGNREKDAERYSALIKALTGREPRVYHMKGGRIII